MSDCKEDVIKLIDEALECKSRLQACHCQAVGDRVYECDGCKIKRVLKMARVCVIQGSGELDLLKVRFIGVQEAIIAKLKGILLTGGNGGKGKDE